METGTPVVASGPETSQEAPQAVAAQDQQAAEKKANLQMLQLLSTIQYLLTTGSFKGDDAHLVMAGKQFCIDLKKHLETVSK